MWHLYKNKQNKFEIAFISKNGRYIVGSKQGYSKRVDAVTKIHLVVDNNGVVYFQDDTRDKSVIMYLSSGVEYRSKNQNLLTKPYRPK